ncbi:serine hydrolase domain-containing protein [Altererythrobacter sp. ZODW24]|uniref:serine hydrolase domain-containing protein n=1 Tax=Altererythrobacter sp. ZODW24 TaxID=2185142 RepID=UPI0013B45FE5|nr:serine hydrolase domain-containing protein [Altererythrobacter sp. ZODW24]
MLRTLYAALLFAFAAAISAIAQAQDFRAVDEYLSEWESDEAPGLAVAISKDGETVYRGNFGLANLEHGIPIADNTRFHIASVSKQFAAFAIMLLEADGKLSLSDDIRKHLPQLQPTEVPVTINHLLSHTGGLREHNTLWGLIGSQDGDARSPAQAVNLLERQEGVNFPAGAAREYSNTGYFLLAEIVARVSGQSYAEFADERMFSPLGMTDTRMRDEVATQIPYRARSYFPQQTGFNNAGFDSAMIGSTGVITTAEDMMIWARNYDQKRVGSDAVFRNMAKRTYLTNGQLAIGANGQEYRKYAGFDTWSHGGTTGGYKSFLLRIPEAKISLMILGNRGDLDSAKIAFAMADILLAKEPDFAKVEAPAFTKEAGTELDKYVGDYELFAGTFFSLARDGDELLFSVNGPEGGEPVQQIAKGSFLIGAATNSSLDFTDFEGGRATGLRYQIGLHGFIPAARVDLADFDPASVNPADYAGTYYSRELQATYVVTAEDGALILREPRATETVMNAYQADTFRPNGQTYVGRVKFQRGEGGNVTGALVSGPLANDILFERIELPAD